MKLKLLIGIVLFLIGIVTAVVGIVGVAMPQGPNVALEADHNEGAMERAFANAVVPIIAGLSLSIGGLLIGLSMGNWKRPRSHHQPGDEIVNPEGYDKMKHV